MELFDVLYSKHQEMQEYNLLHKLEAVKCNPDRTGFFPLRDSEKKREIAERIKNNYNKLDDTDLKQFVQQCFNSNDLRNILLNYELSYFKPKTKKYMSIDIFTKNAQYILNRYQYKAGGFLIEDSEWKLHKSNSVQFDVPENEVLLENTIHISDYEDCETLDFLDKIVIRLKLIADNIKISLRFLKTRDKIIYLLLWIRDKSIPVSKIDL